MFIEKRYLVKLNSIKYCLLLIKQKQNKKIKNTETYLNETILEYQEWQKRMC